MNECIVIKCGGSMLERLDSTFFHCIEKLKRKYRIVIVHGGGPDIDKILKKLQIPIEKKHGLRVTSQEVMEVVQMVLCGSTNKNLVQNFQRYGLPAIGISGCDGKLLQAKPLNKKIGYVGEVSKVESSLLEGVLNLNYIPIIAPIGIGEEQVYNINADIAVLLELQTALRVKELIFITDVDGLLYEGKLVKKTDEIEILDMIEKEIITGGMIPKVQVALVALRMGIQSVSIVNGTKNFIGLTGEWIGTTVTRGRLQYE
ncbi:acetylglutamate kinase [Bacillus cytotoxicus]